jgi:phosphatidylglycerophosphate synthase
MNDFNDFNKELKEWFFRNLANAITISGFFAVIWLLVIAIINPEKLWLITILALFVGISDFFDGRIARKLKIESEFGSVIDRLRDKVFVTPILIILIWRQDCGLTNLPFVIISFTAALITSLAAIEALLFAAWWIGLFKKVTTMANKWGKRKMFCDFLIIMFWLLSLDAEKYFFTPVMPFSIILIDLVLIATLFLALKSLEGYWQSYHDYQL